MAFEFTNAQVAGYPLGIGNLEDIQNHLDDRGIPIEQVVVIDLQHSSQLSSFGRHLRTGCQITVRRAAFSPPN